MKKYLVGIGLGAVVFGAALAISLPTEAYLLDEEAVDTQGRRLADGDLISAADYGDPDIYIIHFAPVPGLVGPGELADEGSLGYKRLFLNPAIFNMYGHLGGFANVHRVTPRVRDAFATSGLFRNCETNDQRVWATEISGEDDGILHHVQLSGARAAAEDAYFFHKVFCINSREERFYPKSTTPYLRLADIPPYSRPQACAYETQTAVGRPCCPGLVAGDNNVCFRFCTVRPACLDSSPRCLMPEPVEGWCPIPTPTPRCAVEGQSGQVCCPGLSSTDYWDASGRAYGQICVRAGCYYKQVQCITTPCNPVLVCPTPLLPPMGRAAVITDVSVTWPTANNDPIATITVNGTKPTPCDRVVLSATGNDSAGRIEVTAVVATSPYACAQVVTPFSQAVTATTNSGGVPGSYDVFVNGRFWTWFSVFPIVITD